MNNIGARLKELREKSELTAKDLSERIKINASTISKLENNKKSIDSDELKKYSSFFNATSDFILGLDIDKEDIVMYMKKDKNLDDNDIKDIEFIMELMDEAVSLYSMKK